MADTKPIKLYTYTGRGPNPPKVAIILEELGLPYKCEYLERGELKQEPFLSVNPNGRIPAIEDPNTGVTIWESGAIIDYLIEQYDKEAKLHYTSFNDKWQSASWKYFQVSGQGPYFGQYAWFKFLHAEKIESAIERYKNEIKRVLGVIDGHLKKTGHQYLIGEKCCFVDLMFVPWNRGLSLIGPEFDQEFEQEWPLAYAWNQKLVQRESVKKVYAEIDRVLAEQGGN